MNGGLRAGKSPARPLFTASPPLPSTIADEPRPRSTTLPNGLVVTSECMPGVRSVALGAWVRAASLHERPDAMGVSHLLEHMVFKGTERRSAKEIALALEGLGGSLDAYTAREHTAYHARALDANLREAADVLVDLVYRPLLRATDLKLERQVVLEEISMVQDTPDDLVFELHNETLWGGHPIRIFDPRDSRERLAVGCERPSRAPRSGLPSAQTIVAAAGNVDARHLLEILHDTGWADLPRGSEPPPRWPARRWPHRPCGTWSATAHRRTLCLVRRASSHGDPRRYTLALVSTVLGGGMSSRLFQRVREELGLAYAVYTFQSFPCDTGTHGVYAATAPERARKASRRSRRVGATGGRRALVQKKSNRGKTSSQGQVTLSLESVTSRMYRAAGVELYGEPFRSLDAVLAEIARSLKTMCARRVVSSSHRSDRRW